MHLTDLAVLIERSIVGDPPRKLAEYCGEHYSPYYFLIYLLSLRTRGLFLELGVEKGRGCVAAALTGVPVVGIDTTRREEITQLLVDFPNFTFYERPSMPPLELNEIKILHIDTEHSFSMAREEFRSYEPYLANEAIVLFDDTHAMEEDVGRFVMSLHYPMIFDDRLHSCGYVVILYNRKES